MSWMTADNWVSHERSLQNPCCTFWDEVEMIQMVHHGYRCKWYRAVVCWIVRSTLFEHRWDVCVSPVWRHITSLEWSSENFCKWRSNTGGTFFHDPDGKHVWALCGWMCCSRSSTPHVERCIVGMVWTSGMSIDGWVNVSSVVKTDLSQNVIWAL